MNTFKIKNLTFEYFIHTHNNTGANERIVELPLGFYFNDKYPEKTTLIEIGAVLPYYIPISHKVYDPYDSWSGSDRTNIFNVDFKNKNILSISTIEHIGLADFNNKELDNMLGFKLLQKVVNESKEYLITFPIGYNLTLDKAVQDNKEFKIFGIGRTGLQNCWAIEPCNDTFFKSKYNQPLPFANKICIVTNLKEFYE